MPTKEKYPLSHYASSILVTVSRFRSLFDREIQSMEDMLTDVARWLGSSKGLVGLSSGLSDLSLIRPGRYSTDEKESRLRLEDLRKRWNMSKIKLELWLSGKSARHLNDRSQRNDEVEETPFGSSYKAIVDINANRFMPNDEYLSLDRNGMAEYEEPVPLCAISPVVQVNKRILRMGLGSSQPHLPTEPETAGALAARQHREAAAANKAAQSAENARQRISLFSR